MNWNNAITSTVMKSVLYIYTGIWIQKKANDERNILHF